MRIVLTVALIVAAAAQAGAEPKGYCPGGEVVEVTGLINEVVTTDPASPELLLEQVRGTCLVDAVQLEGPQPLPGTCVEGRRVTADGMVFVSRDGTWTWLVTNEVRCD